MLLPFCPFAHLGRHRVQQVPLQLAVLDAGQLVAGVVHQAAHLRRCAAGGACQHKLKMASGGEVRGAGRMGGVPCDGCPPPASVGEARAALRAGSNLGASKSSGPGECSGSRGSGPGGQLAGCPPSWPAAHLGGRDGVEEHGGGLAQQDVAVVGVRQRAVLRRAGRAGRPTNRVMQQCSGGGVLQQPRRLPGGQAALGRRGGDIRQQPGVQSLLPSACLCNAPPTPHYSK